MEEEAVEGLGWTESEHPQDENEQEHLPSPTAGIQDHAHETEALLDEDHEHHRAENDLLWATTGAPDLDHHLQEHAHLLEHEPPLDASPHAETMTAAQDPLHGEMKGLYLSGS